MRSGEPQERRQHQLIYWGHSPVVADCSTAFMVVEVPAFVSMTILIVDIGANSHAILCFFVIQDTFVNLISQSYLTREDKQLLQSIYFMSSEDVFKMSISGVTKLYKSQALKTN